MKKKRKQLWIGEEIYTRIVYLLKVNPESGYKSRTQFVEKALEEKLDKMETEMVLQSIREEGIIGFKEKTRKLLERSVQLEKRMIEINKLIEQNKQVTEEIKKVKHTHRVYKSKKK